MTDSGMDGMSIEALIALQGELDELEAQDLDVKEAREKLDAAIDRINTRKADEEDELRRAAEERYRHCAVCGVERFTPHHETCSHYGDGVPTREAGAYQYLNEDMEVLHTTSVPKTDKEALTYFETVDSWFATSRVKFIWRRAMWQDAFLMMPYEWDRENKQLMLIGGEPIPEGMI